MPKRHPSLSPAPVLLPPRVAPTGVVEYPEGYQGTPRRYAPALRALSALVLTVFALVTIATTSASLGAWCLTSGSPPPAAPHALAP